MPSRRGGRLRAAAGSTTPLRRTASLPELRRLSELARLYGVQTSRDRKIIDLVTREPIRTQRDLVTALRRLGLRVSQATVSRDIKRLGLVKASAPGGVRYLPHGALNGTPPDAGARLARVFRDYVVGIEEGSGLILVKTTTGSADAVAEAIDEARWAEIAGTVAGDNTILVVPRTSRSRRQIRTRLEALTG